MRRGRDSHMWNDVDNKLTVAMCTEPRGACITQRVQRAGRVNVVHVFWNDAAVDAVHDGDATRLQPPAHHVCYETSLAEPLPPRTLAGNGERG